MDIISLNKKAWNIIGERNASPYMSEKEYNDMFLAFCKALPNNARVLDLGCGSGLPVTKALIDKGFSVVGVDLAETMIAAAKKNVPEAEYHVSSMTSIDYENKFDGIISSYSMLCLDVSAFKATAKRITWALKPKGYFLIILNEPPQNHKEEENFTKIGGQEMFSRPYTEAEVKEFFPGLTTIKVDRQTVTSEMYGKEYCLMLLMKKE